MPTLKELKAQAAEQLATYHATAERIRLLKQRALKYKQDTCPHTEKRREYEQGYYEVGRMSGPPPTTVYLVCTKCKKKLAVQVEGEPRFVKFTGEQ